MYKLLILSLIVPLSYASAQSLDSLITGAGSVVTSVSYLGYGVAFLFFFWGIAKFIFNATDPEKVKEGKKMMFWGVVALFVLTSVWAILLFMQVNLFGTPQGHWYIINTPRDTTRAKGNF